MKNTIGVTPDFADLPDFNAGTLTDSLGAIGGEDREMLLDHCLINLEHGLANIEKGLAANDAALIADAAHQLKSVAGTFGLKRSQHLADNVEIQHKAGEPEKMTEAANILAKALPIGIKLLYDYRASQKS